MFVRVCVCVCVCVRARVFVCLYFVCVCVCRATVVLGLSKSVFAQYPVANLYEQHKTAKSTPGTITVHECVPHSVINMIAQVGRCTCLWGG